mmetsp:Transcript_6675/g.24578  ORF Transcript_6675/g.24578 Transcript_6675/m.24578 type:complete len:294 (+) Transcript_6675:1802-2683(+)
MNSFRMESRLRRDPSDRTTSRPRGAGRHSSSPRPPGHHGPHENLPPRVQRRARVRVGARPRPRVARAPRRRPPRGLRRGRVPAARRADRGGDGDSTRDDRHRALARARHRDAGVLASDGGLGRPARRAAVARGDVRHADRAAVPRRRRRARRDRRVLAHVRVGRHGGDPIRLLLPEARRRARDADREVRELGAVHVLPRAVPAGGRQRAVARVERRGVREEARRALVPDAEPVERVDRLAERHGDVLRGVRPGVPDAVRVHAEAAEEGVIARGEEDEDGVTRERAGDATVTLG